MSCASSLSWAAAPAAPDTAPLLTCATSAARSRLSAATSSVIASRSVFALESGIRSSSYRSAAPLQAVAREQSQLLQRRPRVKLDAGAGPAALVAEPPVA